MEMSYQQQYMLQHVPVVFHTFMTTFFADLHNELFAHFSDASFRTQYMEEQQSSIEQIQEIIDQYALNVDFHALTDVEALDIAKDAYIEIANYCADFQKKASSLLATYFPDQYPDYFLNTASTIHMLKIDKQELETALESLTQQFDTLQEEMNIQHQAHVQAEQQAQQQIMQLNDVLAEKEQNLIETQQRLDIVKKEHTDVTKQLETLNTAHDKLLDRAEKQHHLLQDETQKVQQLQQQNQAYEQQLQKLQYELDEVCTQRQDLQAHIHKLEDQTEQLKQEVTSIQEQLVEKEKHYDALLRKQKEMADQRYEQLENDHTQLEEAFAQLKHDHIAAERQNRKLQEVYNQLLAQYEHIQRENIAVAQQTEQLEQEKQNLLSAYATQRKELVTLKAEKERHQNDLQKANQQILAIQSKYTALEEQLKSQHYGTASTLDLTTYQQIIAEKEKFEQQLQAQIKQLNADLAEKQQEHTNHIIEKEELKDEIRRLREHFANNQIDAFSNTQQLLGTEEKQKIDQEMTMLKEKMKKYKQAFRKEADQLEKTIQKSQELAITNERLSHEKEALLNAQYAQNAKQQAMTKKIEALEKEVSQLRSTSTHFDPDQQMMIFQALDKEKTKVQQLTQQLEKQKQQETQQTNYINHLHEQIKEKISTIQALEEQVEQLSKSGLNKWMDKIPFPNKKHSDESAQIQMLRETINKYIDENKRLKKQLKQYDS